MCSNLRNGIPQICPLSHCLSVWFWINSKFTSASVTYTKTLAVNVSKRNKLICQIRSAEQLYWIACQDLCDLDVIRVEYLERHWPNVCCTTFWCKTNHCQLEFVWISIQYTNMYIYSNNIAHIQIVNVCFSTKFILRSLKIARLWTVENETKRPVLCGNCWIKSQISLRQYNNQHKPILWKRHSTFYLYIRFDVIFLLTQQNVHSILR